MNTKDIEPQDGFFMELSKGQDGTTEAHVIHSCESTGNSQKLSLIGIQGCYLTLTSKTTMMDLVNAESESKQYYEIEHNARKMRHTFDAYDDGKPAVVARLSDAVNGRLKAGVYFIPSK